MIPNLKDLPPLMPEPPPRKPLLLRIVALLMLAGLMGGMIWFVTTGAEKMAGEEQGVTQGLRAVAHDIWLKGSAPELGIMPPELPEELFRLQKMVAGGVDIMVLDSDSSTGGAATTHELLYLQGRRQVLALGVRFDRETTKVDILTFAVGAGYQATPGRP